MDEIAPGHVAIALILSPRGTRGDLNVESLAEGHYLSPGRNVLVAGRTIAIEGSRPRGHLLHLKLSGVDDRSAADQLRQRYLQIPEKELEPLKEGRFYRFQLIGLAVRSISGEPLGSIVNVEATPSNDLYIVHGPRGEILIPAIDDIVKEIDLQNGAVTVEVVPGLIPPPPAERRRDRSPRSSP